MKEPIFTDLQHLAPGYDPAKAHAYYLKTRQLKGRHKGPAVGPAVEVTKKATNPFLKEGLRNANPHGSKTKTQQKKELGQKIQALETRLHKLEALIRKKEHEAASENRKGAAKKERAAKAKDKPQTAAEKAKINRDNKQYRAKNQQKLKTKAKQASGSSSSSSTITQTKSSGTSLESLVKLAVKVKGQIQVAKQKLAAL